MQKLVRELIDSKPGYLKKSPLYVTELLGIKPTYENVIMVKSEMKKLRKNESNKNRDIVLPSLSPEDIAITDKKVISKEYLTRLALESFMENGNYDKAIDFINKIKNEEITPKYNIPTNLEGLHIVMACYHVPFHNKYMHRSILNLIKDLGTNIKGFHLAGDFLDLNSLSSHDNGMFTAVPGMTLNDEYKTGNNILDEFDALLPKNIYKTYLYGNHEYRYNKYMKNMQNAKTPIISPRESLNLNSRGYEVKEKWDKDYINLGKLDIMHGIYYNEHSAKKHIDTFKKSCVYGHTHRIQSHIEGDLEGFNIGAIADFNSPAFGYASRAMKSKWGNGFAIVNIDKEGNYFVEQVIFKNNKFYFGGKEY